MKGSLPHFIKRKQLLAALVWGVVLIVAVTILVATHVPDAITVHTYAEIEAAYAGRTRYVKLAGETIHAVSLDSRYMMGVSTSQDNRVYIVTMGDHRLAMNQLPSYLRKKDEEATVYKVEKNDQLHQKIDETITACKENQKSRLFATADSSQWYEKKITALSGLEELTLSEQEQTEGVSFLQGLFWVIALLAVALMGAQVFPVIFPHLSATYKRYRDFGEPEAAFARLDAAKQQEGNLYTKGNSFVSTEFIVVSHFFYSFIAPSDALLWVYPAQVTKTGRYGSVFWCVECCFTNGCKQRLAVEGKEEARKLSDMMKQRFPHILAGFSFAVYDLNRDGIENPEEFSKNIPEWQKNILPREQADIRKAFFEEIYQ